MRSSSNSLLSGNGPDDSRPPSDQCWRALTAPLLGSPDIGAKCLLVDDASGLGDVTPLSSVDPE